MAIVASEWVLSTEGIVYLGFLFTHAFALWQDLSGHLEAPADVGVVGLLHSQLTYGYMRSGDNRTERRD